MRTGCTVLRLAGAFRPAYPVRSHPGGRAMRIETIEALEALYALKLKAATKEP